MELKTQQFIMIKKTAWLDLNVN